MTIGSVVGMEFIPQKETPKTAISRTIVMANPPMSCERMLKFMIFPRYCLKAARAPSMKMFQYRVCAQLPPVTRRLPDGHIK